MNVIELVRHFRPLATQSPADTTGLETRIGHRFASRDLLTEALTHPSLKTETPNVQTYQRLEFLGDAVLGMILAEALFNACPEANEGFLANARSALAKGSVLARIARNLGLADEINLADREKALSVQDNDAVLENTLEAILGAIYVDAGYDRARSCALAWYAQLKDTDLPPEETDNPKGTLQETLASQSPLPLIEYRTSGDGPNHCRIFHSSVFIDHVLQGQGSGRSKRLAEQSAARAALARLPHKNISG